MPEQMPRKGTEEGIERNRQSTIFFCKLLKNSWTFKMCST
jgi:hypothetical protein